jgi:DNA repair protein RadC
MSVRSLKKQEFGRILPSVPAEGSASIALGEQNRFENLINFGPDILSDLDLLEITLRLSVPPRASKRLAKALLGRFGSFADAISAPASELRTVEEMNASALIALKAVHVIAQRLLKARAVSRPLLDNWDRLMDYLNAVLARERVEQFRVLFLDTRNCLLKDEELARGTVNHAAVYPREVVKRALELHATALILVHNHPCGDPTPSSDDIEMTRQVRQAAGALNIVLHDHVIVGNGRWLSLRKENLM